MANSRTGAWVTLDGVLLPSHPAWRLGVCPQCRCTYARQDHIMNGTATETARAHTSDATTRQQKRRTAHRRRGHPQLQAIVPSSGAACRSVSSRPRARLRLRSHCSLRRRRQAQTRSNDAHVELTDELGDGSAGDSAAQECIQAGVAQRALLRWSRRQKPSFHVSVMRCRCKAEQLPDDQQLSLKERGSEWDHRCSKGCS